MKKTRNDILNEKTSPFITLEESRKRRTKKVLKRGEIIGMLLNDAGSHGMIIDSNMVDDEFDIEYMNSLEKYEERMEYLQKHRF